MNVFLTGGTGYFGRRLAERLLSAGHGVTALVRSAEKGEPLCAAGAKCVVGDVAQFDAVAIDFKGFDAVIHSAALVANRAPYPGAFDKVNVGGVANVARRALDAGVKRFIYTSSFMALGPSDGREALDESARHDPNRFFNDYERTKYQGLVEFDHWVARGLPGAALIPCVIYGRGTLTSGNLMAGVIAQIVERKLPGILGGGRPVWTYSYIEDVVDGHVAALDRARAGERYILGGQSVSMAQFVIMTAAAAGVEPPRRSMPFWMAKAFALTEEARWRATGRDPRLTRDAVEAFKHSWAYSSAKAQRELGYKITPLADGLKDTVAWVREAIREGKLSA